MCRRRMGLLLAREWGCLFEHLLPSAGEGNSLKDGCFVWWIEHCVVSLGWLLERKSLVLHRARNSGLLVSVHTYLHEFYRV